MSDTRVKRERFLPYAYERLGLSLELQGLTVDGHAERDGLDAESRLVDLRGVWSEARLEFGVGADADLLQRLLPDHEQAEPPVAVLLALRCETTRLRRGVVVPWKSGGRLSGDLVLRHDELAQQAEVHAYLVRTRDAMPTGAGFAANNGHRIAGARPYMVRVDLQRAPAGRHLNVQFKRFSEDAAIPPAERGALWRLDAAMESPILWLNQDHATVAKLLTHEGSRGRRAYLREVVFDRIVASVWLRLFLIAAPCILEVGEATYGWEQAVLDLLLPQLYPAVPTMAGRLERLRQEYDDIPELVGRLQAILQTSDDGPARLTRLIEAL